MSNIDIEIGAGHSGAVGIRGTYAQHSFLAHMDFRSGPGIAGRFGEPKGRQVLASGDAWQVLALLVL